MMKDIILNSDVYAGLDYLDDSTITAVITSPPYWKQRDYNVEGQIGQEKSPEEYIFRLVTIFNKLCQKLKEEGVFFLNVGDKYLNKYGKSRLLMIPYRLAYHMVKDGWHLEDIIIWYKPNHMPSSVKDRFANTYEPIFVFAKSKENIYKDLYKKVKKNVVEIPLQQTPWKHTAVYPENLVEEMLNRVNLNDGDIVLDPFAGTGTTGVVVKNIRNSILPKKVYSIMIEKSTEFVEIIKKRTGIENIIKLKEIPYTYYLGEEEEDLPNNGDLLPLKNDKYGEVYIAQTYGEFLSVLKGMCTKEFKDFHREDAIYFLGIKELNLQSLYYIHTIHKYGYVLRNMLVINNGINWYPIFMLSNDTTRVAYKFYLDRVRISPKTKEDRNWTEEEFIGMKVSNVSGETSTEGRVIKILYKYPDEFPKIVVVQWNEKASIEFVMHPGEDEFLIEGLKFFCPKCNTELIEPYDPIGKNICHFCGLELWTDIETIPIIKEPKEILDCVDILEKSDFLAEQTIDEEEFKNNKNWSYSKFYSLDRINWGASPGARKTVKGEYFTKMRLYRVDQPVVAQYLTLLRKSKNMSILDIVNRLPKEYYHTVGHWFRKDFGGSIPIPNDIKLLRNLFNINDGLLKILERTALRFQTVKASIKGKNPGDYFKGKSEEELITFLKKLYIPSYEYILLTMEK
ncbi:MAG TPA: site-specific DNA-methyltransferase [Fervidobacterium sp.]|nr:site-specific DNA-methyltransferase [Fervidobacterium sp.]